MACPRRGAKSLSEKKRWLNTNWALGFIFEWNCDQRNSYSRKSIGNVVCKTEAILSQSQCVNNNNVAHSSHSGLNINDGGLWRFNCNLPSQSWCVVMSTYTCMTSPSSMLVPDHCVCKWQHSTFAFWWFTNAKLFTWCLGVICRQCYDFNN